MTWYKIVFKCNSRWCFSEFYYTSEEMKEEKLKLWKAEHVTPYNKIEIISYGVDN